MKVGVRRGSREPTCLASEPALWQTLIHGRCDLTERLANEQRCFALIVGWKRNPVGVDREGNAATGRGGHVARKALARNDAATVEGIGERERAGFREHLPRCRRLRLNVPQRAVASEDGKGASKDARVRARAKDAAYGRTFIKAPPRNR